MAPIIQRRINYNYTRIASFSSPVRSICHAHACHARLGADDGEAGLFDEELEMAAVGDEGDGEGESPVLVEKGGREEEGLFGLEGSLFVGNVVVLEGRFDGGSVTVAVGYFGFIQEMWREQQQHFLTRRPTRRDLVRPRYLPPFGSCSRPHHPHPHAFIALRWISAP